MIKGKQTNISDRHYYSFENSKMIGNNGHTLVKDNFKYPKKFYYFIHTQKRDSKTNCKTLKNQRDFYNLNPGSLHQAINLMNNRGILFLDRHQYDFGSHAFYIIDNKRISLGMKELC